MKLPLLNASTGPTLPGNMKGFVFGCCLLFGLFTLVKSDTHPSHLPSPYLLMYIPDCDCEMKSCRRLPRMVQFLFLQ
ncbi:unnamed protein product, partial [Allacma fusca]